MPRKARNQLVGNYFHIMIQGIKKEYIFDKDIYKKKYIQILSKHSQKENVKIIAYCVMSNHVHLLMYIENIQDMSKFMHDINAEYGQYYNAIKNRVGFVFRNRFNTQEILDINHLRACVAYIHKNPVKAEMVKHESLYQYSSYNEYFEENKIISYEGIKLLFGTTAKEKYIEDFIKIHECKGQYFFEEDEIDYGKVIKEYKQRNISNEEIVMNLSRYCIRNILGKKA